MAVLLPLDCFVSEFEGRHLDLSIFGADDFFENILRFGLGGFPFRPRVEIF